MTSILPAMALLVLNLGLIWLLMAAPVGRRTITFRRTFQTAPERLWQIVHPGAEADWMPAVLSSRPQEEDACRIEVSYRHSDRHGRPIRRVYRVENRTQPGLGRYESQAGIVEDSALDISFWRDFEERRIVCAEPAGASFTYAQTDTYRGLAVYLFRYFMIRRELSALAARLAGVPPRTGGIIEHPATQVVFAILSTLILWPFFGLTPAGLTISVTLTVVIVLHELGHMVAYRAFGHQRVRMIFVPLLGGIAIGGRPYNSRFEIATCALMGPGMSAFLVPVLVLLQELADGEQLPQLFNEPVLVFLLILGAFNLLNLLPMSRFDGGQVLRQVFPSKPVLLAGSFGITLLMLAVGYRVGLSETALIAALAVFTLMSLIGFSGSKLHDTLEPMGAGERLMAGLGLYAGVAIHAYALIFACDRLFG